MITNGEKLHIKISQHVAPHWQIPEKLEPGVKRFIISCVYAGWRGFTVTPSWQSKMDGPCYRFLADKSPYNHLISYYQQPQMLKLIFISVKKRNPPWHCRPLWSLPFIGDFFFSCECCVCVCVSHASGNSRRRTNKPDGE